MWQRGLGVDPGVARADASEDHDPQLGDFAYWNCVAAHFLRRHYSERMLDSLHEIIHHLKLT